MQVLEESKGLVRNLMKGDLEQANDKECEVLKKIWGSAQGMDSMLKYLQRKIDEFWRTVHWHWNCIYLDIWILWMP